MAQKSNVITYGELYYTLNEEQKNAFDRLADGENIFITGNAGTGKSYLVRAFDEHCLLNGIHIVKTAPTGIAANEIGGATLHHQFKLKVGLDFNPITKLNHCHDFLMFTDVLLIDEISMVRIDIFDKLMQIIGLANQQRAEKHKKPIQLVFVGDFFQLPPVISKAERPHLTREYKRSVYQGYCFQSTRWRTFDVKMINLTHVIRQSDVEFCSALDSCKMGDASCLPFIRKYSAEEKIKDAIWICGKNQTAFDKNQRELGKLPGETYTSEAVYKGSASEKDKLCDDKFNFKIGAKVVMLTNDTTNHYYQNGSIGTIVGKSADNITVSFDVKQGNEHIKKCVEIQKAVFSKYEYCLKDTTAPPDGLKQSVEDILLHPNLDSSTGKDKWEVKSENRIEGVCYYIYHKGILQGRVIKPANVSEETEPVRGWQRPSKGKKSKKASEPVYTFENAPDTTDVVREMIARAFIAQDIKMANVSVKKRYTKNDMKLVKEEIGKAEQYPMRLGYAVTVHKSQGQTYDAMNFIPEIWDNGQLYVALSRCKTIKNIFVDGCLYDSMVKTSSEVLKFYNDPESYTFFDESDNIVSEDFPKKIQSKVRWFINGLLNESVISMECPKELQSQVLNHIKDYIAELTKEKQDENGIQQERAEAEKAVSKEGAA